MDRKVWTRFILFVLVTLPVVWYFSGVLGYVYDHASALKVDSYEYDCESYEEQVQRTNTWSLDYYSKIQGDYDSVLISPLAIQGAVYKYQNSVGNQNKDLFEFCNNGYISWKKSGEIFDNPCFTVFLPNEVDTKETLVGKASNVSGKYIRGLGVDIDFKADTLYSISCLGAGLENGIYSSKDDMIYYSGCIEEKKTSDYQAVKIPLSDKRYCAYFIEGDVADFDMSGFSESEALVAVNPYTWQSNGKVLGVVQDLGCDLGGLAILNQFGFDEFNHEVTGTVDFDKEMDYFYVSEYTVMVVEKETGLVLMIGKRG